MRGPFFWFLVDVRLGSDRRESTEVGSVPVGFRLSLCCDGRITGVTEIGVPSRSDERNDLSFRDWTCRPVRFSKIPDDLHTGQTSALCGPRRANLGDGLGRTAGRPPSGNVAARGRDPAGLMQRRLVRT